MTVILFRPASSRFVDAVDLHHDLIRSTAMTTGMPLVELSGSSASWAQLFRLLEIAKRTENSPRNVILLCCESISGRPVDNNQDFLTDAQICTCVQGCGFFFVGGHVCWDVANCLLRADAGYVISFENGLLVMPGYEKDVFNVIGQGVISLLENHDYPQVSVDQLRQSLLEKSISHGFGAVTDEVRALMLLQNSESLHYIHRSLGCKWCGQRVDHIQSGANNCDTALESLSQDSAEKPITKLRNSLALSFAYLYIGVVVSCLAVSVFKDADSGVKLLASFQGAITAPLGVAVGYLYGKSRAKKMGHDNI